MLNLLSFVKRALPTFDKSDLLSDMELSLKAIETVNETYLNIESTLNATKFNSKKNTQFVQSFYKELKLDKPIARLSVDHNLGTDMIALFANIRETGKYIYNELDDAVNDAIISTALTSYKAILMRAVAHYSFMTEYALKLANYLYLNEVSNSDMDFDKAFKLNKKQESFIEDNVWIFARLISVYGSDPKKFEDKLKGLEEVTIFKDKTDEIESLYRSSKIDIFENLPAGFVGSPIYTVRLIFATWQADRYRNMKDEKKLLELRYLHYKMLQETDQTDSNMEREISHLQKRITDLDFKLARMEDSVNGYE